MLYRWLILCGLFVDRTKHDCPKNSHVLRNEKRFSLQNKDFRITSSKMTPSVTLLTIVQLFLELLFFPDVVVGYLSH